MADGAGARRVTSSAVSVQVWFPQDELVIRPGESASLALAIENVGDRTETYTVIPAGLTASWTTVTRPNVTLFGGSRDVVEVVVRPPAIHSTSAGPTSLAVRIIPQASPDDAVVAETIITVGGFDDRRITVLQPLQRGRRRSTFEFMVENHGNNLASCRLHLIDASHRVDGAFDPPAVGVAPGSASLVRLRLRAQRSFFRRAERQLDFEIEASEPDHEPAAGRATLIQPPTVPAEAIGRALALAACVAAIVLAWFGVVRPELRDAAERAVDDRLATIEADAPSTTAPVTATTLPPEEEEPVAAAGLLGDPVAYRIAVDVGITDQRSESISVPPDSRFCLTDTVLQNPNGDIGDAQLLRNGDVLYEWDLAAMNNANEFQPRVTCLPFEPADNIVLSVTCEAAGDPSGTGCEVAALLGGVLIAVEA
jgi:hypothetical protein